MTPNPCYKDNKDCERRRVGCRSTCQDWKDWEKIHAKEVAEIREKRCADIGVCCFLADRDKRIALDNNRRATENHLKRIGKK